MPENVVNAPKSDLKNQLFRKMSEIVQTLPKASECIPIGPNRSERVRTGPNWSEHVQKLQQTCENFKNITENFEKFCMELSIGSRRYASVPGLRFVGAICGENPIHLHYNKSHVSIKSPTVPLNPPTINYYIPSYNKIGLEKWFTPPATSCLGSKNVR